MRRILTINSGSSSIKFALYAMGAEERLELGGKLDRIGLEQGGFVVRAGGGRRLADERLPLADHAAALAVLFDWLEAQPFEHELDAAGHRVVHGGSYFHRPEVLTAETIARIEGLVRFAPSHLPHALEAIGAVGRRYPKLAQVGCFDTAFHRRMPALAQWLPVNRALHEEGVLRYGFHGLSYEYIMEELEREMGEAAARLRILVAHLGNGSSMAAIHGGYSVDTSMGFTPTAGLMMSTRTGDLDPGVVFYLLEEKGLAVGEVKKLLNNGSGLAGVSGSSSDVADLLERETTDPRAREALDLYCYLARKQMGALTAAMGGLDLVVFTGGIGENAAPIRERMLAGLGYLGIELDAERNRTNAGVISAAGSRVAVRVMATNEELVIARHTRDRLFGGAPGRG